MHTLKPRLASLCGWPGGGMAIGFFVLGIKGGQNDGRAHAHRRLRVALHDVDKRSHATACKNVAPALASAE